MRNRRRALLALGGAAVVLAAVLAGAHLLRHHPAPGPPCSVTSATTPYGFDLDQAANATTIATVGKSLGLPDHAVTVALSAALLESQLHDLTHGDRDSLGLFQQRPSQGWGTPAQLLTPSYAASAFYRALERVPGWDTLPVTVAAQRVQRSALPNGYAQEEGRARALAIALTGEAPAGMTCHEDVPRTPVTAGLQATLAVEVGPPNLGVSLSAARGWTVAMWLVAHAVTFRIVAVGFGGMRWTASRGTWVPDPSAGATLDVQTVQ